MSIDHLVTESQGIENNVWIIGDDTEVIVIDPSHDAPAIREVVGGRQVRRIVMTHGHWDHIRAVHEFGALVGTPQILMHEADRFLWDEEHPGKHFEILQDGARLAAGGIDLEVRHTPGHTPGSCVLVADSLGCVFSGDTLFRGGPGATRWDYSSFDQLIGSITDRLLVLPDETAVHTGHGPSTSIGQERPDREAWIARGW